MNKSLKLSTDNSDNTFYTIYWLTRLIINYFGFYLVICISTFLRNALIMNIFYDL